jgi:NAD(P)-dependent dehydrogenase (short-subunit alcohol dehydrogenase family)
MRLRDKVAIVTGAARGIGRMTAELFVREGATVYATDLDEAEPADGVTFMRHDVADDAQWADVIKRVKGDVGYLSILVNNAGVIGSYEPIDTIALADYERIVAINQTGVFLGIRHCAPLMREGGGGSIVNLLSIWGSIGASGVSAYQASKGAVIGRDRLRGALSGRRRSQLRHRGELFVDGGYSAQ